MKDSTVIIITFAMLAVVLIVAGFPWWGALFVFLAVATMPPESTDLSDVVGDDDDGL